MKKNQEACEDTAIEAARGGPFNCLKKYTEGYSLGRSLREWLQEGKVFLFFFNI